MVIKRMRELEEQRRKEEVRERAEAKRRAAERAAREAKEKAAREAQEREEEARRQQRIARTKQILKESGVLDGLEEIRRDVGGGGIFGARTYLGIGESSALLCWDFYREEKVEPVRGQSSGMGEVGPSSDIVGYKRAGWEEKFRRSIYVNVGEGETLEIGLGNGLSLESYTYRCIPANEWRRDRASVIDALAGAYRLEKESIVSANLELNNVAAWWPEH